MNATDPIRALFEYNGWANGHVLAAVRRADAADLQRELGASFGSVQGNLTHMLFAQRLWLSRWTGQPAPPPSSDSGIDNLAGDLAASDAALLSYVDTLPDSELDRQLDYTDTQGNRQSATLWHTLLHVANHGTHHRAEVALLLTALGHPPRQLDFAFFTLEKAGASPRLT